MSTPKLFVRDDFNPEWLMIEQAMGGRQTLPAEPVEISRQRFDGIFASIKPMLPPPDSSVSTADETVPKSNLKIRIYTPAGHADSEKPLPVGLYIHSGGFYSGSIEHEDFLARDICKNSNIILYSPEYRLAPEHSYPAGHEDVYQAYEYMVESAARHAGDVSRRFVLGGSAGGNLTASVCLKYARDSALKPSGAVILCPAVGSLELLKQLYPDRYDASLYDDAPMIGNEIYAQAWKWLAPPADDGLANVLIHSDLEHLCPIYLAATTKDPTYPGAVFFAEKCSAAGVDIDLVEWKGWPHFFHVIPCPTGAKYMATLNEKLRAMIAKAV